MSAPPRLVREGLLLDGELVPLLAGSVHYWRLPRAQWRPCLEAVRSLGLRLVDTYVPWGVHETSPGVLELGERDPQRDVVAFLRLAHELGLWAIVRPGPHINAELTYFGLPERVVWDEACQARSPTGNRVMLPILPRSFPVPSYASDAYLDETTRFFSALGEHLAPLRYPAGPIVLLQVDNEGALFFRDGLYDQDYHPDAVRGYRDFLRGRYGTLTRLREVYRQESPEPAGDEPVSTTDEGVRFADIDPPTRFDATRTGELAAHLDWAEFQEHMVAGALARMAAALDASGLGGVPTMHNFPLAQDTTPLNAARISTAVDLIGLDYYGRASESNRAAIARRTSELSARCDARELPAYGCELGAGFPPYFPPLSHDDCAFTALCALAYGLRGFNVYMAVARDRWVGAPIARDGTRRPSAAFWDKLCHALEQVGWAGLRRPTPVKLVLPRVERRLARVFHAFGPASGALFSVLGGGARESCAEDLLDADVPLALQADSLLRSLEWSLERRGVPHAVVGSEEGDQALDGARWLVCATSGAMPMDLALALAARRRAGCRVSLGPQRPRYDETMRPSPEAGALLDEAGCEVVTSYRRGPVDDLVAEAVSTLGLPVFPVEPEGLHVTVHEDGAGAPAAVFLVHTGDAPVTARVTVPGVTGLADALDGTTARAVGDTLELPMSPLTVRMLVPT